MRTGHGQYPGTVNAHSGVSRKFCVDPCEAPDNCFSSLQFSRPTFFLRLSYSVMEKKSGRGFTSALKRAFIIEWSGTVFWNCQRFVVVISGHRTSVSVVFSFTVYFNQGKNVGKHIPRSCTSLVFRGQGRYSFFVVSAYSFFMFWAMHTILFLCGLTRRATSSNRDCF